MSMPEGLDEQQRLADEHEQLAQIDLNATLPTDCQTCVYRPTEAGGNNGCINVNLRSAEIDTLNNLLNGTLGELILAAASDDEEKSYMKEYKLKIGRAAVSLENGMIDTLSDAKVLMSEDEMPQPPNQNITICFRPLSDLVDENTPSSVEGIVDVAVTLIDARRLGLKKIN